MRRGPMPVVARSAHRRSRRWPAKPAALAQPIDPKSAAQFEGRLDLARHNLKANSGYAKTVQGWDEQYRPFGLLGTLLK